MKPILLLAIIVCLFSALACRPSKPINTYSYEIPQATAYKALTTKKMHDIIVKSCIERGWRAVHAGKNILEASIIVRGKHTVVVSIPYTANSYSINYKSSVNMEYKGNKIHPNYNNWVHNLDQTIRSHLALERY